jgi:hypothetical protein
MLPARIYGPKLCMRIGKKYDYLGVDMELNDNGTLDVSIITYLKNVMAKFPEIITGKAAMPAADHMPNCVDGLGQQQQH